MKRNPFKNCNFAEPIDQYEPNSLQNGIYATRHLSLK